jgi:hypothetical protein
MEGGWTPCQPSSSWCDAGDAGHHHHAVRLSAQTLANALLSVDNEVSNDTKHTVSVDSLKTSSQKHYFTNYCTAQGSGRNAMRDATCSSFFLHFQLSSALACRCLLLATRARGAELGNHQKYQNHFQVAASPHSMHADCGTCRQHQHSSLSSLFLNKKCATSSLPWGMRILIRMSKIICNIHSRAAPYVFINECAFN